MRVMLTGAHGQLGSDLAKEMADEKLVPLGHQDVEVCDYESVQAAMDRHRPEVVINTAAYHKVDECERNVEKSFAVNAFGVRNVALACRKHEAILLHMSTDYVFDGRKGEPYLETDAPNPINVYGISKLAGEYFVCYLLDRYFIVRSSGLYGVAGSSGKGGNFVELMLRLAREGKDIRVVHDQRLTPTHTVDLARKIHELIATEHYGLYHVTNSGHCSWYEFAQAIFEKTGLSPNVQPTTTEAFGAVANRPRHSVLARNALSKIGLDDLRTWNRALDAYLEAREKSPMY